MEQVKLRITDNEMLKQIRNIISQNKNVHSERKPQRITKGYISKELGIPVSRLVKMPKCMMLIEENEATYEEYWCFVIKWAAEQLIKEQKNVTNKNIIVKAGICQSNMNRAFELMEKEFFEQYPRINGG